LTGASRAQTQLHAKKSKRKQGESRGFGKQSPVMEGTSINPTEPGATPSSPRRPETSSTESAAASSPSALLQSVAGAVPSDARVKDEESDSTLPPEERAARILREKYGMKTLDEQQVDLKQQQAVSERRKQLSEWKKKVERDEDFDVMSAVPAPLLKGIDGFLKVGVAVAGVLFVLSGIGITLEAWSKTTGSSIDPTLDKFIVETIEPNFTTGLLILLGFSVSLGLFAAAQLGSAGAQYKEDE
jgi:ABC-type dipeptide/oligopeptide/nickel transport system permease component